MKKCSFCGTELNDDCIFCTECGKRLTQDKKCPNCGENVGEGDAFCRNCGKKLKENNNSETIAYEDENTKKEFKKFLPYILVAFVIFALIGYFNSKDSKGGNDTTVSNLIANDSTIVEEDIPKQDEICAIEDIVEFFNLMEGCSDLTSIAKSNYQKARPFIEAIAKRNGFTMYEYHYVNGDLGDGEMSSYICYLYKNCTISKDSTGYPTFTPSNNGGSCYIGGGEISVADKQAYDELVRHVKERCGVLHHEGDQLPRI